MQVVDDNQQLAREVGDRILAYFFCAVLGPPSRVFRIGQRAQQAVAQCRILCNERAYVDRFGCDRFILDAMRHSHLGALRPLAQASCR
jgi:hypothetical protein